MNNENYFSDEHLNAFVDDQLDSAERNRVVEALARDADLSLRINELRKLKELVRYAYNTPTKVHSMARRSPSRLISSALAAGLLSAAAAGGWYWHASSSGVDASAPVVANVTKKRGVVLQISDNDPAKWDIALINAKNIRKEFPQEKMDIEIVAYGPGLEMFKKDSRLGQRLDDAANSGVKLLACGNTMEFTRTTQDQLNSSVEVVKAGVVEILQKQEQGYSYIRR